MNRKKNNTNCAYLLEKLSVLMYGMACAALGLLFYCRVTGSQCVETIIIP